MKTPIVIADDSSMSRKLVTKALPPGWAVDITYATNGREALEACRTGKGHVMFLDLTMPEMDGFEVLEHVRSEDLKSMVIVISADVQAIAQERAMALGALAFVKKPVEADKVQQVLRDFGIV